MKKSKIMKIGETNRINFFKYSRNMCNEKVHKLHQNELLTLRNHWENDKTYFSLISDKKNEKKLTILGSGWESELFEIFKTERK